MTAKLIACLLAGSALATAAHAADPAPIRITVISDQDDDVYNARAGRGGVDATRMAVADFGGSVLGRPIVVDALNDHNKAAEAPGLATQAFDAGADLLMDLQNAPIAAAVSKVAAERHKLAIGTNAANPALTRAACSRYFYHYSYDLPAIAGASANYLAAQPGNSRWVMVAADSGFGKGTAAIMAQAVAAHGGTVVKTVTVPAATTDFATALDDVRAAKPNVVGVFSDAVRGDAGATDMTGAKLGATVTTPVLFLSDVDRVKAGYAGVVTAVPWYWNLDATARSWADRFAATHDGLRPEAAQAADYSATTQWLQAVREAGTTDADAVVRTLDGHSFTDAFARHAQFRASDHMVVHDLYIARVRPPAELAEPHGWFDILATVPAAEAFPADSTCTMPR